VAGLPYSVDLQAAICGPGVKRIELMLFAGFVILISSGLTGRVAANFPPLMT
jgi:hypothetical protein